MDKVALLYDPVRKMPGCVLLQALAGCSSSDLQRLLPDAEWLTAPTPDMRRIFGTEDEWKRVHALSVKRR